MSFQPSFLSPSSLLPCLPTSMEMDVLDAKHRKSLPFVTGGTYGTQLVSGVVKPLMSLLSSSGVKM